MAVEIPRPDEEGRHALLRLYGHRLRLTPEESAEIVAATAGATASLFAELARRAELLAAADDSGPPGATHTRTALDELTATRDALAATSWPKGGPYPHPAAGPGPLPFLPGPGLAPR